jgi:Mrp family chromosome partitioning ATPase/capsular polysaccharide biosynthesis protein
VTTDGDERQDWRRYVEALRAEWLLILVAVLVSVGVAGVYTLTAPKRYQASVDVLVTPLNDDVLVGINTLRVNGDPNRAVLMIGRIAKTREVADGVRERLGTHLTSPAILASVSVQPIGQASVVRIVATRPTAAGAAAMANAYARVLLAQRTREFQGQLRDTIETLRRQLNAIPADVRTRSAAAIALQESLAQYVSLQGAPDPTLRIVAPAVPPSSPSSPRPRLTLAIALIAGLLLGCGLAIANHLLRRRLMNEDELIFSYRLPVLARIPHMKRREADDYLAGREPLPSDAWEAYRTLRANLLTGLREDDFPRSVLVTSAVAGEGKTMSCVNLAIALAAGGMRVVLVDGDLRRPMLATVFSVPAPDAGFASFFADDAPNSVFSPHLVSANGFDDRLRLLLSNPPDAGLVDFLEPSRLRQVFAGLKREADVVIVDSPGATEVADALAFANVVDSVLIAVRLGHTPSDRLNELRALLAQHKISPLGFVVTTRRRADRYGDRVGPVPHVTQEDPLAWRLAPERLRPRVEQRRP